MKRMSKIVLGTVVGGSFLVALAGFRGDGWHCRGKNFTDEDIQKHSSVMVDRMLDDLSASPDQRTTIQNLKNDLLKEGLALRGERDELHREILTVWQDANPDPSVVHAKIDARVEQLRSFAHSVADSALELHKTLTPEQRNQVTEKVKEKHGWE